MKSDSSDHGEGVASPALKPRRRWLRALAALVAGVLSLVSGVLVVAACMVLDPPSELMRRSALPIVRQALNHPNVNIGSIHLNPLKKIEIRDIWIGPPKGYGLPLLTIERITAEYDVSAAGAGRIHVRRVEVERPLVRVEAVEGKLNWLAFLEGLPPSEPKPEPPPSDPPEITVDLDRAAVIDFGAYFDDGKRRAVLDGFNVTVGGKYTPSGGTFDVELALRQRKAGKPSLAVKLDNPALVAKLAAKLKVNIKLARLIPARARVKIDLDVVSRELSGAPPGGAPQALAPVSLRTLLAASFDQDKGLAELEKLEVRFNDHRVLDLAAKASDVLGKRADVVATLEQLSVPLALLQPYISVLRPGLEVGGKIEVAKLHVATRLDRPAEPRALSGRLKISQLAARVSHAAAGQPQKKGELAAVRGINAELRFAARRPQRKVPLAPSRILAALPSQLVEASPAAGAAPDGGAPDLQAHGELTVALARAASARVENLRLRFAGGAEQDPAAPGQLATVAGRLGLSLARVTRRQPGLGQLATSLDLELAGGGDLRAKTSFSLDRLRLVVDRLISLRLSARLDGGVEQGRYRARLALDPLDLGRALKRVPRSLRGGLGGLAVSGRLGLKLDARGRLPRLGPASPLSLALARGPLTLLQRYFCGSRSPLAASKLDLALELSKINLRRPPPKAGQPGLNLQGLDGTLALAARQGLLTLDSKLALVSARAGGASVARGKIPLALRLDPKQLGLSLGFSAAGVRQPGVSVASPKVSAKLTLSPSAPLLSQPIPSSRRFSLTAKVDVAAKRASLPAAGLRVSGLALTKRLMTSLPLGKLIAGRKPPSAPPLELGLTLAAKKLRATLPGQKVDLAGLSARLDLGHAPAKRHPVRLALEGSLARLAHQQLGLRAKGMRLGLRTAVGGLPLSRLPPPPGAVALERIFSEPLRIEVDLASLRQRGALDQPLRDSTIRLEGSLKRGARLALKGLRLRAPSRGVRVDLSGSVDGLPQGMPKGPLPAFDLQLRAALDAPRTRLRKNATLVVPGLKVSGKAGVVLRLARGDARAGGRRVRVSGRLIADRLQLWQRAVSLVEREEGGFIRTVTRLRVRNLNADVPFFQDIDLDRRGRPVIPPPRRSIFDKGARSGLYEALRPYSARRATLALDGVDLAQRLTALTAGGQLINARSRGTKLGKLAFDLAVGDSTLALDRFYFDVFGGDVAGSINAQLVRLKPLDARVALRLQLTGIDLKRLDPAWQPGSSPDEISTLLQIKYGLARRELDGRIDITQFSLKQLDGLLAFLDPNKVDESVQRNRKLLKAWYMKLARIKLVAIWIAHSNLNIDIDVTTPAYFPAETLLRLVLKNNRIRRLNIRPLLPRIR